MGGLPVKGARLPPHLRGDTADFLEHVVECVEPGAVLHGRRRALGNVLQHAALDVRKQRRADGDGKDHLERLDVVLGADFAPAAEHLEDRHQHGREPDAAVFIDKVGGQQTLSGRAAAPALCVVDIFEFDAP